MLKLLMLLILFLIHPSNSQHVTKPAMATTTTTTIKVYPTTTSTTTANGTYNGTPIGTPDPMVWVVWPDGVHCGQTGQHEATENHYQVIDSSKCSDGFYNGARVGSNSGQPVHSSGF